MAYFQNDDLEYVVNDYYGDVVEFEEDNDAFADNQPRRSLEVVDSDSDSDDDFEDDLDSSQVKSDTSALEARNGKDIQGIPWERLNFTRDKYREARLKQYKNYESLGRPRQDLEKECLQVEKGKSFYDFHYNTRLVKSTIVHFQQRPGLLAQPLSRVQISTMAVKDNLLVAGGFQAHETTWSAFCSKLTTDENAITNAVDIFRNPTGSMRMMTANNDAQVVFDIEKVACFNRFSYEWSVNNTSVSPNGKLLAW